jgi:hypothetical protein
MEKLQEIYEKNMEKLKEIMILMLTYLSNLVYIYKYE